MIELLVYLTVAVLYESISILNAWSKFKKKPEYYHPFKSTKDAVLENKYFQVLKAKVFNYYTIPFIIFPFCVLFFGLLFPFSIYSLIKRSLFGKSKLEKEAESESIAMEHASNKAKEFMATEGEQDIVMPIISEDFNPSSVQELNVALNKIGELEDSVKLKDSLIDFIKHELELKEDAIKNLKCEKQRILEKMPPHLRQQF